MSVATDLFREIFAISLIIAATILAALGKMATDQWMSFAQIIFGSYVIGKTATSVTDLMTAHKRAVPITSVLPSAVIKVPLTVTIPPA
jgi:hypothetical protein